MSPLSLSLLLISPYPCRSTVTSTSISLSTCAVQSHLYDSDDDSDDNDDDTATPITAPISLPVCLPLCLYLKEETNDSGVFLSATTLATFYRYQNQENKCALGGKREKQGADSSNTVLD